MKDAALARKGPEQNPESPLAARAENESEIVLFLCDYMFDIC